MHQPILRLTITLLTLLTFLWSGLSFGQSALQRSALQTEVLQTSMLQNSLVNPCHTVSKQPHNQATQQIHCAEKFDHGSHCPSCSVSSVLVATSGLLPISEHQSILNPIIQPQDLSVVVGTLFKPPRNLFI